jgi:hypothetical protein
VVLHKDAVGWIELYAFIVHSSPLIMLVSTIGEV